MVRHLPGSLFFDLLFSRFAPHFFVSLLARRWSGGLLLLFPFSLLTHFFSSLIFHLLFYYLTFPLNLCISFSSGIRVLPFFVPQHFVWRKAGELMVLPSLPLLLSPSLFLPLYPYPFPPISHILDLFFSSQSL